MIAFYIIGAGFGLLAGLMLLITTTILTAKGVTFIETERGIFYIYKGSSGLSIRWLTWDEYTLLRARLGPIWNNISPGGTPQQFLNWIDRLEK